MVKSKLFDRMMAGKDPASSFSSSGGGSSTYYDKSLSKSGASWSSSSYKSRSRVDVRRKNQVASWLRSQLNSLVKIRLNTSMDSERMSKATEKWQEKYGEALEKIGRHLQWRLGGGGLYVQFYSGIATLDQLARSIGSMDIEARQPYFKAMFASYDNKNIAAANTFIEELQKSGQFPADIEAVYTTDWIPVIGKLNEYQNPLDAYADNDLTGASKAAQNAAFSSVMPALQTYIKYVKKLSGLKIDPKAIGLSYKLLEEVSGSRKFDIIAADESTIKDINDAKTAMQKAIDRTERKIGGLSFKIDDISVDSGSMSIDNSLGTSIGASRALIAPIERNAPIET